jgi:Fe-S-cluster-containing dehydrogenase component
MSIEVIRDNGAERPYERCAFCREPTAWWFTPKDVAVCPKCARAAEAKDVPNKKEWCRREQIAEYRNRSFGYGI